MRPRPPALPNLLFNGFLVAAGVELLFTVGVDWLRLSPRRPDPAVTGWVDFVFLLLGAANLLLALARRDGWRDARRSCAVVLGGAAALTLADALTGLPFGRREYLGTLGPQPGPWPPASALLVWNVAASGHLLGALLLRRRPRAGLALLNAAWGAAAGWAMDPLASRVRAWWQWMDGAMPASNPAAWAAACGLLTLLAPWGREPVTRADPRPFLVACAMGLTFLAGKLACAL